MRVNLSVIIISYNSENFISECVSSVLKYLPQNSEIIVLDNASKDKTLEKLTKFLPKIKLIKSKENLGFSKGNNQATRESLGEYLFFLNPDTEIEKPTFDEIIEFYKENADVGIIGPKLIMSDGRIQPSVRNLPNILGAMKEYIFGIKNSYSEYVPDGQDPIAVESVYGAAMLISKKLFEELGGFDENFFLYYEDIDLCRRVINKGKKVYYYPKISIKHLVGATKSLQNRYKINKSSFIKYHGVLDGLILQLIFQIYRFFRHF